MRILATILFTLSVYHMYFFLINAVIVFCCHFFLKQDAFTINVRFGRIVVKETGTGY